MDRDLRARESPPHNDQASEKPAALPAKYDRRVTWLFVMLFLLYMFDYVDRQVVTSLFPFLKTDLGLTDTQAGLLVSAVYWSIVVLAFPASILIDRWSRRRSIGIMVVLWSIATGLAAFVKTFPQLFLARLGVGIGEAGYSPGGTAMISAMYPREKRSRMVGLWNASIPLGSALGVAIGGIIATRWGWKHAFGLVALPGFILAILFFFFARDYRTVKLEKRSKKDDKVRAMRPFDVIRSFLQTPSLLLTYVAFSGNTLLSTAYLTWLPSYFNRYSNLSMSQAGLKSASVLIFAIVGAPLGGLLVDAWLKSRTNARPLFAGLASLLSACLWLVAFGLMQGTNQYIALMVCAIFAAFYISGASALTQDVVHPGLWAISWSICVIVQNLAGSSLGPILVGAISDRYGLRLAMLMVPASSFVAGILFVVASRFYERDLRKVANVRVELE
jgi:MFS family permease